MGEMPIHEVRLHGQPRRFYTMDRTHQGDSFIIQNAHHRPIVVEFQHRHSTFDEWNQWFTYWMSQETKNLRP